MLFLAAMFRWRECCKPISHICTLPIRHKENTGITLTSKYPPYIKIFPELSTNLGAGLWWIGYICSLWICYECSFLCNWKAAEPGCQVVVNRIHRLFELKARRGRSLRKLPVRYPAYGGRPAVNVLQWFLTMMTQYALNLFITPGLMRKLWLIAIASEVFRGVPFWL